MEGVSDRGKTCRQFGEIVRELRTKQGFSQEAFADEVQIHRTYIGGIERGERNPTLTMICRIAKALHRSPSRLLRRLQV
jgi:transcriptional regulator with XRE-family HTH domain